ncbi:phosphate signaling complex protein PhoU [Bifidobacterium sp. SMB2]|uniref:Phosphate-specific transport system accessory protein PhoU n=1 Tax=Bifidobacterium saimiriisciurei TaxID=2661627 RepID=A0ABX0CAJ2_9BIFI|nr:MULTISPECIES: phosphate signaling complex protein PhoU [Bifidobacterium]NEG95179.1 phosphate signaling complex protein PhoU [Bifidobacterium sp. SMB2]NEH11256.1 phosphate signaling complex protein PhoU [Bifidobacterium saimiriisciurei]
MRVIFNEELKQVADDLDRMAQEVRTAILGAGKALLESDVEAAQSVIDGDLEIDALETSVINQCVQLLAKQSPVATDLRVVVSTLRLASTFERMGDLARHVAEIARRTYPESALTPETREVFSQMQAFLDETTKKLITALDSRDEKLAEQLIIDDDKLDDLHHEVFDIVNGENWTGNTQQTIDVVLLGRFYERFGDHAVSVARRLVYIVSGFDPSKAPKTKADSSANDPYLAAPEN